MGFQSSQYDVSYFQEFNHDPQINYQQSPYELAAFVEDKWRPFARTIAQLGLRVRYLEDGSRVLWEPRVSLSRGMSDRVRVKLGGGVYHQYLQLIDLNVCLLGNCIHV